MNQFTVLLFKKKVKKGLKGLVSSGRSRRKNLFPLMFQSLKITLFWIASNFISQLYSNLYFYITPHFLFPSCADPRRISHIYRLTLQSHDLVPSLFPPFSDSSLTTILPSLTLIPCILLTRTSIIIMDTLKCFRITSKA